MGWKVYGMGRSFEGEDMDRELEKRIKKVIVTLWKKWKIAMVNVADVADEVEAVMAKECGMMMMSTEKDAESKVLVLTPDVDAN